MNMNLHERLKACIAIELGVADIYRAFTEMLPEAKEFWYELAMEEENHASILVIGSKYNEIGKLPDYIVPDSLPNMKTTLELVRDIDAKIKSERPSLKTALDMALLLEKTMEESYMPEVLSKETDSEVASRLKKLLADTRKHKVKVAEYMKSKGFK
jgi:hypothetical protein